MWQRDENTGASVELLIQEDLLAALLMANVRFIPMRMENAPSAQRKIQAMFPKQRSPKPAIAAGWLCGSRSSL